MPSIHHQSTSTHSVVAPSHSHGHPQVLDTTCSAAQFHGNDSSPAQTTRSQSSHASAASPHAFQKDRDLSLQPLVNSGSSIPGILVSLPAVQRETRDSRSVPLEHYLNQLAIWPDSIPTQVEDHLVNVYFDNANRRWPFLLKNVFYGWHLAWKRRSTEQDHRDLWQGFFVNMVATIVLHSGSLC